LGLPSFGSRESRDLALARLTMKELHVNQNWELRDARSRKKEQRRISERRWSQRQIIGRGEK
jgi:hypothetical protein